MIPWSSGYLVDVKSLRLSRIRPVAWSSSYLFRFPLGISIVTSNSTVLLRCPPAVRRPGPTRGRVGRAGVPVISVAHGRGRPHRRRPDPAGPAGGDTRAAPRTEDGWRAGHGSPSA